MCALDQHADVTTDLATECLDFLFDVLARDGSPADGVTLPPSDAAAMRIAAANGLLRLARLPKVDALMGSSERWQNLAWVMQVKATQLCVSSLL